MKDNLDPERVFPVEVLALKGQGIPLPTWYSGPLYLATPEQESEAMAELLRVRAEA